MNDILKLALIFAGIVVAIRFRVFVGYALLAAGLATALFFRMYFEDIWQGYLDTLLSGRFLRLYIIIVLITFMGRLLREIGYLDRLVNAARALPGGARTAAAVIPALIGLMPMPGGALMSAPLVSGVVHHKEHSPEFMTAVNYWSRHVVEYFWPVYPGIILSAALAGVSVGSISLLQLPMSLVMIPVGIFFFVRKIKGDNGKGGKLIKPSVKVLLAVWPIILTIVLYALFPIDLVWAVAIALVPLISIELPSMVILRKVANEALTWRLLVLVFGIISFQHMLELTGAVESIPAFTSRLGLPAGLVIFAVCFSSGMLTGMVAAFVGLSYPILAAFLYQPEVIPANIFLAYISGYLGMMLSPAHFCLVLSTEYFKADLGRVYRLIGPPLAIVFLVGILVYLAAPAKYFVFFLIYCIL
ncbi:MAG: DUF401 family protein [candidate division Zixibacteria bacterium]|nr:DUF401 family protein [candidate division Zixibacteria bacterium]